MTLEQKDMREDRETIMLEAGVSPLIIAAYFAENPSIFGVADRDEVQDTLI